MKCNKGRIDLVDSYPGGRKDCEDVPQRHVFNTNPSPNPELGPP